MIGVTLFLNLQFTYVITYVLVYYICSVTQGSGEAAAAARGAGFRAGSEGMTDGGMTRGRVVSWMCIKNTFYCHL